MGVSDIHIEPYEKSFRVRYRLDGVLRKAMGLPLKIRNAIISRIKIMAKLDIAERRLPQDGRIELNVGGKPVDIRVSTLPTMFGESVVMQQRLAHDAGRGTRVVDTADRAAVGLEDRRAMRSRSSSCRSILCPVTRCRSLHVRLGGSSCRERIANRSVFPLFTSRTETVSFASV